MRELVLSQIIEEKKLIKFLIVNFLTTLRGVGPIYLVYLSAISFITLEMIIIGVILALFDKLDGVLAGNWDVRTEFGAQFDKIVDKVFTITLFCILCVETPWAWSLVEWMIFIFTALFNLTEFLVFFLGTVLAKVFGIKIAARRAGKIKVLCEYLVAGIWGYLLYLDPKGNFFKDYQLSLLVLLAFTLVLVLNSAKTYWRDLKATGKI